MAKRGSPEWRAKLSKKLKGRKMSKEWCEKIGNSNRGQKRSKETCKRISESTKGKSKSRPENGWNKSWFSDENPAPHSKEQHRKIGLKVRERNLGKKWSEQHKRRISLGMQRAYRRIIAEIEAFEKEGYRCVPTDWRVRPDFIAIKDGKIYAVEVEYGEPNYSKYDDQEIKKRVDEVIWLLRSKE